MLQSNLVILSTTILGVTFQEVLVPQICLAPQTILSHRTKIVLSVAKCRAKRLHNYLSLTFHCQYVLPSTIRRRNAWSLVILSLGLS
jgi:hypothetical protein